MLRVVPSVIVTLARSDDWWPSRLRGTGAKGVTMVPPSAITAAMTKVRASIEHMICRLKGSPPGSTAGLEEPPMRSRWLLDAAVGRVKPLPLLNTRVLNTRGGDRPLADVGRSSVEPFHVLDIC